MRLSRKIWVMIVLSITWVLSAMVYTHNANINRAESFVKFAYKVCTDSKELQHDANLSSCNAERTKNMKTWMDGSGINVAFAAFAPLPFAWLAAFILLYVVRAQLIGFRATDPWSTLRPVKKGFVVFCALFSLGVVLFSIVSVMNLYVDTMVPVSPNPFLDVINMDNLVSVTGTWTRTDLTDDTIASPLQTSKIECSKLENRCIEALASVSGTALMAEVINYDIQSWTPAAIVLRKDSLCETELFTIDLNTKVVSGAGHRTHENELGCRIRQGDKTEWSYQLSNGFKVYWALRQNARPFVLRAIQSIVGN